MKTAKIVLLVLFGLFAAQVALAQTQEETFAGRPDPLKSVQLFPNPATEFVSVKFELPHARKAKLALHSIIGNTLELESEIVDDYEVKIRVKDLPSGYYFLAVSDEESHAKTTHKFLKR